MSYQEVFESCQKDPESFWGQAAEEIHWSRRWDRVLDDQNKPFYHWFSGGLLNTCYNALDRHVESGRADQTALIYDSPLTDSVEKFTYRRLRDEVALFAGALKKYGLVKGDRVIIYMPMVPQAVIAMLACARIGVIHSVVFGGFAPQELATRLDDADARMVITASCGLEVGKVIEYKPLLDEAIRLAQKKPEHCIVLQRPRVRATMVANRDVDWQDALQGSEPAACVPVEATHPLYILYTSGTTGIPKGVVRDNGGHAVALKWSMKNIYNMDPGDTFWAASDVGWVVGHSYIVYGPLLHGCTTILYEGKPVKTPDAGAFWRVIRDHGVNALFTAPTAFRAIRREDPKGAFLDDYALPSLRTLFLAGERCDPETLHWAEQKLGIPVIDHWWQTETGWPMTANCMGLEILPVKPGSTSVPVPGYDIQILDEEGKSLACGEIGNIAVKLPLPPGCLPTLWENDEGYIKSYISRYPGYFLTGDAGMKDEDGYMWIMSRIDDIINVAGHRLSTGGMEEVLATHPDVAECAVIGLKDRLKGELPMGLLVLKAGVERDHDEISAEVVRLVREKIGPLACFKVAVVVQRLPKTRSGKILRGTMKKIGDGTPYRVPATIDDPVILEEITAALSKVIPTIAV